MFVGHLGVGLAMKKASPEINLGVLLFAALLLDFLLGLFVLTGLEQVLIAPVFRDLRDMTFVFPYSHSLLATLVWAALSFGIALWWFRHAARRLLISTVIAGTVALHWVLDVIVHVPEMTIIGTGAPAFGLSLYGMPVIEAVIEVALVVIGLALYFSTRPTIGKVGAAILIVLMALLTVLTVTSGFATTPPQPVAAASTWVLQSLVLGAVAFWIDRRKRVAA